MSAVLVSIVLAMLYSVECQIVTKGIVTCDNEMEFYADGVLKATSTDWTKASLIDLATTTNVYGFKCTNKDGPAAIRGVFTNGVKTNALWKCINTLEEGWNLPGFNDSSWPLSVLQNPDIWGNRPMELSGSDSDWIWTAGGLSDSVVYCRHALGPYSANSLEGCSEEIMAALSDLPPTLSGINADIIANITSQLGELAASLPGISTFFQTSLNTSLAPINQKIIAAKLLLNESNDSI